MTFISFGTKEYRQDRGNPASSAEEVRYWSGACAKRRKIRPILVRMIPFSAEFKHSAADRLFNVISFDVHPLGFVLVLPGGGIARLKRCSKNPANNNVLLLLHLFSRRID